MAIAKGVTEEFWGKLNEDQKIKWRLFTRGLTLILSLIAVRTGWKYFDWIVASLMALLPMLVIDSQRAYTNISRPFRRVILRVVVLIGPWLVALLGIAYVAPIAVVAIFSGIGDVAKINNRLIGANEYLGGAFLAVLLVFLVYKIIQHLRKLGFEELIFHIPKKILIEKLVRRRNPVRNWAELAQFEFQVLACSLIYTSVAGAVCSLFFSLVLG